MPTTRFSVDLTEVDRQRLEQLAVQLGMTMKGVVKRLIDVASIPDASKQQRLCVCDGDRVVAVIAWS